VASLRDGHVGSELFLRALEGGGMATGQSTSGLQVGAPADLVALSDDDPMLTGHGDASRLDALVFSGYPLPIERVMVNGEWRVRDGVHVRRDAARDAYAAAVARLGASQ
jgi:formimidoylglutamate deiminase